MDIEMTPTQKEYIYCNARELLVEGSAGSGKTIFACYKTIFYALQYPSSQIYVYRVTLPSLKRTSWKEIKNLLWQMNIPFEENKSEGKITILNGNKEEGIGDSVIHFGALDEIGKVRSLNADLIYIEQAEELKSPEFYQELMLRLGRGPVTVTRQADAQMLLVVQPEDEEHWIYKRFHELEDVKELVDEYGKVIKTYDEVLEETKKDRVVAHFHYKQNYKLPPKNRAYYDNLRNVDEDLWLRYSAGKWGKLSGVIYKNYDTVCLRTEFERMTCGIDFGYNNPACFLLIAWHDDESYVLDEVYVTEKVNTEFIDLCDEMLFRHNLLPHMLDIGFADKANPDKIEEFVQRGYNVEKSVSDVDAKISTTKQTKIHIHPRCVETIKEIKGYKWKTDNKTGKITDEPLKINDHAMDALAYCCYGVRGPLSPSRFNGRHGDVSRIKIW